MAAYPTAWGFSSLKSPKKGVEVEALMKSGALGLPHPAPTSTPAPLAPGGSQASKRKFLIGHYITGGLATTAAFTGSTLGAHSAAGLWAKDCLATTFQTVD